MSPFGVRRSRSPESRSVDEPAGLRQLEKREQCHTITITEVTPRASTSDRSDHQCPVSTVRITLDQRKIYPPSNLNDPLTGEKYHEFEWYLERCLREVPFNSKRKDEAEEAIAQYGQKLANELQWHGFELEYPNIKVDVRKHISVTGDRAASQSTIHTLHWEQLEAIASWPGIQDPATKVRVRRVIDPIIPKQLEPSIRRYKQGKQYNILLVVARDLEQKAKPGKDFDLEDVSPAVAYRSIINTQDRLNRRSSGSETIRLEVVRPGSFEALEHHLQRRTAEEGLGYFRLVHFDTHGILKTHEKKDRAKIQTFLRFAREHVKSSELLIDPIDEKSGDLDLSLTDVPADKIAKLLQDHSITCAILTACNSGRANRDSDTDLCRIFAEHGVSEILAISFGICTLAVRILCETFYRYLFIERQTLSEAASNARAQLRKRSNRKGFGRNPKEQIDRRLVDWFIPVTYSPLYEGNIFQPAKRYPENSLPLPPMERVPSTASAHSVTSWLDRILDPSTHNGNNNRTFLSLDVEVLKLEMFLMKFGVVLLHGPLRDNDLLLEHLGNCWKSTHFLKEVVRIDAREFLDTKARVVSATQSRIRNKSSLPQETKDFIKVSGSERTSLKSVAIIIKGLDVLFPVDKTPDHLLLEKGVNRLKKFLDKVVINPQKIPGKEYKSPFVIFLAEDNLINKLVLHFPDLGAREVLRSRKAIIDEFDTTYS